MTKLTDLPQEEITEQIMRDTDAEMHASPPRWVKRLIWAAGVAAVLVTVLTVYGMAR